MLDQLIHAIQLKKENGGGYILLLGAGCSIASGCPSARELVRNLIRDNGLTLDPNISTLDDIERALGKAMFNLSMKDDFANSRPSPGYWFLAELVRRGYFNLILTTNYDTCLEKALAAIVGYDGFRTCTRGDISDERINELIELPAPQTKIIKLHGDYLSRNMRVSPKKVWQLEHPLNGTLSKLIADRGIIISGYSMHDSSILRILPTDTKQDYWYIATDAPDDVTRANLKHAGVEDDRVVHGPSGDFDAFFSTLSKGLGAATATRAAFEAQEEDIVSNCTIQEVDTSRLHVDLDILCVKIRKAGIPNLVFIHDPDAPGGSELLRLISKKHHDVLDLRRVNTYTIHIQGRGKQQRKATKVDVVEERVPRAPDMYLLIDSVSFSGRTLEICRDHLIQNRGAEISVRAAVVYSGRTQERKLTRPGYCLAGLLLKARVINTHQILFPWGLTQATEPIIAEEPRDTIDEYVPYRCFSFLPRPWGNILSLKENKHLTAKILYIAPREMTSTHRHSCRNEIFLVLDQRMILQVWDRHILLRKGGSFRVPAGTEHRLIGLDEPCRVLELSESYHDQVEDVVRSSDKYNRVALKGDV